MSDSKKINSAPSESNENVTKHTKFSQKGETSRSILSNSTYDDNNRPSIDNNLFWDDRSNPLSSKGN